MTIFSEIPFDQAFWVNFYVSLFFVVVFNQKHTFYSVFQRGSEGEDVFRNLSDGLQSSQASKCGDLLTLMLKRSWPKPQGGVPCSPKATLKHVLTWKLWPGFFQRFGNGSFFTLLIQFGFCNAKRLCFLYASYLKLYSDNEIKPYRRGRVFLASQQPEHLNTRVLRFKHFEFLSISILSSKFSFAR